MQKVSGFEISKEIIERLKKSPRVEKSMMAVLVGDDPVSISFVREKERVAEELGIEFDIKSVDLSSGPKGVIKAVEELNADTSVGGIIVQLPLPQGYDRYEILRHIAKEKDVDALGSELVSRFYMNEGGILPPAVGTVKELVERLGIDLERSRVAIVGLGLLVGKPIALYMMHRAKEIILLDKRSDIEVIRSADLVISGAGKGGLIRPETVKDGAVVIDFGYDYSAGRLLGDFDHADGSKLTHIRAYTPTPGGTGPILVAKLFENFYRLQNFL